jgi:hypothetical protein
MAIKIQTSSIGGPSTIYPNWDFWFEKIPSGNTGASLVQTLQLISPVEFVFQ